jgi:hypothetical protein
MYLILIKIPDLCFECNAENGDIWKDCGEGPFPTRESAELFARSEVGWPWVVVKIASCQNAAVRNEFKTRNE